MRILVIEDDELLARAIKRGLEIEKFSVDIVSNGQSAQSAILTHDYKAMVLDLGLPGIDGMTLLEWLRFKGYQQPVIIITARFHTSDKVIGLNAGADDFIIKPFDLDELTARLRAVIRRSFGRADESVYVGDYRIDLASRRVFSSNNEEVQLTAREFSLLTDLINHRGMARSKTQIEEALYGWGDEIESNSVEVYIHHLRKKLGKDFIKTIHGVGYMVSGPQLA